MTRLERVPESTSLKVPAITNIIYRPLEDQDIANYKAGNGTGTGLRPD
jgi:hypothetical protein